MTSILVVDNDLNARSTIASALRDFNNQVSEADSVTAAIAAAESGRHELIVCSHSLPDSGGYTLLRRIRDHDELRTVRIIMICTGSDPQVLATLLESGADDVVVDAVHPVELQARVNASLRRQASLPLSGTFNVGGISMDDLGHRVTADGTTLSLAPTEYRLLQFLLGNPDRVFSRQRLLVNVWDRGAAIGPRTVDVHIRRLRSLLEPYGYDRYIQTVRGSGYRFSLAP